MPTVAEKLNAVPRKMLAKNLDPVRKPLAEDWNRLVGQAIERAILLARLTKQEVAHEMGYSDQSTLSRWISGAETAQLPKLFAIDALREPLAVALAELAGAKVDTHLHFPRTA